MKKLFFALSMMLAVSGFNPHEVSAQRLKISEDHRHIIYENDKPFFYLGDTAWELFHRLTREEADAYLEDRASKGFTVIQGVVLAELDGLRTPNAYGELPLIDLNPTKPNPRYFQQVDYVVDKAASLGMFIGMLPTWGDKWNLKWGTGPVIFNPDNAYAYGLFLGQRYKDKPVIWILGGDRNPEKAEHYDIIRAMAKGLADGDGGNHLMTYHPSGGVSSSQFFHKDNWLSFDLFQSSHGGRDLPNYEFTLADRELTPVKPTMDGEARYEDHPVKYEPAQYGWFDDFDTRQAGYWSMMSGACGHTYGNHNIWQMWQAGRKPVSWARTNWRQALNAPGSFQAGYMKKLFEKYPWQELVPDQNLILDYNLRSGEYQVAMISKNQDLIFAYTPYGNTLKIDMERLKKDHAKASWFNPRDGEFLDIGEESTSGSMEFTPQSMGRGSDWVLVLDAR